MHLEFAKVLKGRYIGNDVVITFQTYNNIQESKSSWKKSSCQYRTQQLNCYYINDILSQYRIIKYKCKQIGLFFCAASTMWKQFYTESINSP